MFPPTLSRPTPKDTPSNLARRRFQLNMRRIGLIAWALCVGVGGTVGTLYLADAIFGFGLLFLVVTSVALYGDCAHDGPVVRVGSVVKRASQGTEGPN